MLWSATLLLGCFCLTFGNSQFPDYCRSCNLEECLPVSNCIAGKTKDVCGCCEVCAKAEFELCDHPTLPHPKIGGSFGKCGQDLECKIRTDLGPGDIVEAICYCRLEDEVCGSNGKTYDNVCKMKEAAILSNSDITQTKRGPCNSVPIIASLPENVKNVTGSNIAILCEARGYPIPDVTWVFTRVDGKVFSLPSDDLHMSINTRGGPEKWQVTGWLQIIDLKKEHEGDYTCTASNNDGSVKATARVNVVNKEDKSKY